MKREGDPGRVPRWVRVEGRDDEGEVVDEGKNIGSITTIYCVGVHFPATGEIIYYDKKRVQTVERRDV